MSSFSRWPHHAQQSDTGSRAASLSDPPKCELHWYFGKHRAELRTPRSHPRWHLENAAAFCCTSSAHQRSQPRSRRNMDEATPSPLSSSVLKHLSAFLPCRLNSGTASITTTHKARSVYILESSTRLPSPASLDKSAGVHTSFLRCHYLRCRGRRTIQMLGTGKRSFHHGEAFTVQEDRDSWASAQVIDILARCWSDDQKSRV